MGFARRQANDPDLPTGIKRNGTPCGRARAFAGRLVLLALTVCLPLLAQPPADWPVRIKSLVDHGNPDQAMAVAEEWMRNYPQDLDARAWHARLLAWSHRWPEAEAEYKSLVELSPEDSDLLMDLAHLLAWQKRDQESLRAVERACAASPGRADCDLERARLLRRLGRTRESREKYKALLGKGVAVEESKAALAELAPAASQELRVGGTADLISYTDNAGSAGASLASRWSERWRSFAALTRYDRFGQTATSFEGSVTCRFTPVDTLTVGGGAAGDQGIAPRVQAQFEYGHGFHLPAEGFLRGVEAGFQQRWLWYRGARALSLAPTSILYLPKDWTWLFRLSMTQLSLSSQKSWKPAGLTRLTFPIHRALTGHLLFANGIENFGTVDQVLWSATRTVGGGLRIRLANRQELLTFVEYQRLAAGRSQTGLGVVYALRF